MRVLIADDAQMARAYAEQIIRSVGHQVIGSVRTGEDLVSVARTARDSGEPADLAVVDINMPGKGGIWAARILKEESLVANVVIASSNIQENLVNQIASIACGEGSAIGVVGKPYVRYQLLKELDHIIVGFSQNGA